MFRPVSQAINFPEMEKKILSNWYSTGLINKYLTKNNNKKIRFSFLDGPITANNPMGVHHAWGRTYKDLWQRFFNMKGFKQRFQNGFDCQGLWVEVEVEKELKIKNKRDIENLIQGNRKASIAKFVELCKKRVIKYSQIQTEQSKRLGYFMDWDNSYYTMSDENNYLIWYFLKICFNKGWIYKGEDSVPWCPRCETAISQHEMLTEDYKEITHESLFVKLPITTKGWNKTYLLVWTTTPWTIPANVAVGVNVNYTYGIWENKQTKEKIIILSKDENGEMPERMYKNKNLKIEDYIFTYKTYGKSDFFKVKEISGKQLVGLKYMGPFDNLPLVKKASLINKKTFHTVVNASEVVVSNEGTGLLHLAPGAGKEDYNVGKKEKLSVISVIKDDARYVESLGFLAGKNAKKNPNLIIEYLKEFNNGKYILKSMLYTHRYPACWRCKEELVWKVTNEWYIAMDKPEKTLNKIQNKTKTLRDQMIETAKMITWIPSFGLDREIDWLSNMSDWLISKKNRYWGLALPIYECKKCQSFSVIGSKNELKEKEFSGWNDFIGHSPHKPYIDEVRIKCEKCNEAVSRIDDVGNVWLDAGSVPFSTFIDPKNGKLSYINDKKYWREWFPVDFITESFPGQFKNWFYSMIAMSTVLERKNPFKTVLGFASALGQDGRAMHKSWGNSIEFNEGADKIGVDVMRWMFASHDPEQNILFGYKAADVTRRKFHIILWNIYNFFITYANIIDWKPTNIDQISHNDLSVLDKWILSLLNNLIINVEESLEKFDAKSATFFIETFVLDLSQWYIRRSRNRVSPLVENKKDRDACLCIIFEVLVKLVKILAPFIPFLAEEMYRNLTNKESVHLEEWPIADKKIIDKTLEEQMLVGRKLVELGHSIRKDYKMKTRQPLSFAWFRIKNKKLENLQIAEEIIRELNIKKWIDKNNSDKFIKKSSVKSKKIDEYEFFIDVEITKDLEDEGKARDLIRQIQLKRKELGCDLTDYVKVELPSWPEKFTDILKKETMAKQLIKGEKLDVYK